MFGCCSWWCVLWAIVAGAAIWAWNARKVREKLFSRVDRNDVVLITGASTGMGFVTARYLAEEVGYTVYAGVRSAEAGESLKKGLKNAKHLIPIILDVTKEAEVAEAKKLLEGVCREKRFVGLFNNAGISGSGGSGALAAEEVPESTYRSVMDVNFLGHVRVTQAFMPLLRRARGTVIFNTSVAGLLSSSFMSPYSASKFADEAYADALRREQNLLPAHSRVRVAILECAAIFTPIFVKGLKESIRNPPPAPADSVYTLASGFMLNFVYRALTGRNSPAANPMNVAHCIEDALRSPIPKTRYLTGQDCEIVKLFSVLPAPLTDFLASVMLKPKYTAQEIAPLILEEISKIEKELPNGFNY